MNWNKNRTVLGMNAPAPTRERLRVRQTLNGSWYYETLSGDGHVVSQSEAYAFRHECEAAAVTHCLPVAGLSRGAKALLSVRKIDDKHVWKMAYDAGKWQWIVVGPQGAEVARSSRAFKTQGECIKDARENGLLAVA